MKVNESVCPPISSWLFFLMITLTEILRLHLRDEQLGADVDLHGIASKTDHCSGSDLKGAFLYFRCQRPLQSNLYYV